jgi:hypothetical protein
MSKTPPPPELDRRRIARLASDGESTALLAEITGLPRLEIEAAIKVDPGIVELRRHYERLAAEPPEARVERLRRLLLAAVERSLEDGDLRNIGWALKGLGILRPLPGSGVEDDPLGPPGKGPRGEAEAVEDLLANLEEEERELWEKAGYQNWPVPPTVPWRPDAPRPRGPLEIENEAGSEAERAAEPLPWPPPRLRAGPATADEAEPERSAPGSERSTPEPGSPEVPAGRPSPPSPAPGEAPTGGPSRWPPHLRPV